MTDMTDMTTDALFTQYLDIVNRSIGEHRDEFPYDKMIAASDKLLADKNVGVAVYKDDPAHPHHWFTIQMKGGTLDLVSHGKSDTDIVWKVDEHHLENVVQAPQPYIDQPVKLDLDWLKTRIGIA